MFQSSSNGVNSSDSRYEHLQSEPSHDFFNPCCDDFFHNEMVSQHQQNPMAKNTGDNDEREIPAVVKRCSKKDRHSKINTAQGPRDRRMRLSLKVAREFFDLQDQLRFDKASKTIEWLLIQAGSAIQRLSGTGTVDSVVSSTSESEVVPGSVAEDELKDTPKAAKTTACRKGKRVKPSRCPRGKELRAEARAKARERATEKRRREETAAQSHSFNPATSAGGSISGESMEAIEKWSPFSGLSHLYYPEFPQQENEMEDFQFCKSMWE